MQLLDLFAPETVQAVKRVSARAVRDARFGVWALETFAGDEELAAAALMDEARVSWAERSLEYVSGSPHGMTYVPYWRGVVADRRQLLARKPASPHVPLDIGRWIHARLGLVPDASEVAATARKVGTPAHVGFVLANAKLEGGAIADHLALVVGSFPIGNAWIEHERAAIELDLAYVIGHDLAYGTERRAPDSAAARARRFCDAAGRDATYFSNGTAMCSNGEPSSYRGWTPVTAATFDYAVVAVGPERWGIAVFTGED